MKLVLASFVFIVLTFIQRWVCQRTMRLFRWSHETNCSKFESSIDKKTINFMHLNFQPFLPKPNGLQNVQPSSYQAQQSHDVAPSNHPNHHHRQHYWKLFYDIIHHEIKFKPSEPPTSSMKNDFYVSGDCWLVRNFRMSICDLSRFHIVVKLRETFVRFHYFGCESRVLRKNRSSSWFFINKRQKQSLMFSWTIDNSRPVSFNSRNYRNASI